MKLKQTVNIAELVKNCGVVGAGGAGFPTHVKISSRNIEVVIVNGVECEPLLKSDKHLIETEGEAILRGLEIIMEACGAESGYIAIKKKYEDIIYQMKKAIEDGEKEDISIYYLGDYYPAGDEFLLVQEITQKVVPERGIPPQVGCIVENVETTFNIYRAVELGLPVTRRYLTCTGEVKTPSVVRAHIGTSFQEIIELCGGSTIDEPAVIVGGPLMGKVETDLEAPVTKLTSGIIVLARDHDLILRKRKSIEQIVKQSKASCCQCTYCTELCPRFLIGHNLKPHLIMRQIGYGVDFPPETIENAILCSGCGLCEVYACVMGLSPQRINTVIKEYFISKGYSPDFPEREIKIHEMREFRKIPTERIVNRLQLSTYSEKRVKRIIETNPDRVEIMLLQHTGKPAVAVVKEGERVEEGTLIAEVPEDVLGAAVHSSIDGKVVFIDQERIIIQR